MSTQHIEFAEFFGVFLLRQVSLYLLGPYCEKLLKVYRFEINICIKIQINSIVWPEETSSANEDLACVFSIPKSVYTTHWNCRVFLLVQVCLYLLEPSSERLLKVERFEMREHSLTTYIDKIFWIKSQIFRFYGLFRFLKTFRCHETSKLGLLIDEIKQVRFWKNKFRWSFGS